MQTQAQRTGFKSKTSLEPPPQFPPPHPLKPIHPLPLGQEPRSTGHGGSQRSSSQAWADALDHLGDMQGGDESAGAPQHRLAQQRAGSKDCEDKSGGGT